MLFLVVNCRGIVKNLHVYFVSPICVLDSHVDHRDGTNKTCCEQHPCCYEDVHVSAFGDQYEHLRMSIVCDVRKPFSISPPHSCSSCGLDALV